MEDLEECIRRNRELIMEAFARGTFAKSLTTSVERLLAAAREQRAAKTADNALKTGVAGYIVYVLLQRVFGKARPDMPAMLEEDDAQRGYTKCSFCARKYAKQDIVAGPGVFICRECVGLAATALSRGPR